MRDHRSRKPYSRYLEPLPVLAQYPASQGVLRQFALVGFTTVTPGDLARRHGMTEETITLAFRSGPVLVVEFFVSGGAIAVFDPDPQGDSEVFAVPDVTRQELERDLAALGVDMSDWVIEQGDFADELDDHADGLSHVAAIRRRASALEEAGASEGDRYMRAMVEFCCLTSESLEPQHRSMLDAARARWIDGAEPQRLEPLRVELWEWLDRHPATTSNGAKHRAMEALLCVLYDQPHDPNALDFGMIIETVAFACADLVDDDIVRLAGRRPPG